jgi:hypothetical protein
MKTLKSSVSRTGYSSSLFDSTVGLVVDRGENVMLRDEDGEECVECGKVLYILEIINAMESMRV